jgi:hypothetical protein
MDQAPAYRPLDWGSVDLPGVWLNQTDPYGSDIHANGRVDEIRM